MPSDESRNAWTEASKLFEEGKFVEAEALFEKVFKLTSIESSNSNDTGGGGTIGGGKESTRHDTKNDSVGEDSISPKGEPTFDLSTVENDLKDFNLEASSYRLVDGLRILVQKYQKERRYDLIRKLFFNQIFWNEAVESLSTAASTSSASTTASTTSSGTIIAHFSIAELLLTHGFDGFQSVEDARDSLEGIGCYDISKLPLAVALLALHETVAQQASHAIFRLSTEEGNRQHMIELPTVEMLLKTAKYHFGSIDLQQSVWTVLKNLGQTFPGFVLPRVLGENCEIMKIESFDQNEESIDDEFPTLGSDDNLYLLFHLLVHHNEEARFVKEGLQAFVVFLRNMSDEQLACRDDLLHDLFDFALLFFSEAKDKIHPEQATISGVLRSSANLVKLLLTRRWTPQVKENEDPLASPLLPFGMDDPGQYSPAGGGSIGIPGGASPGGGKPGGKGRALPFYHDDPENPDPFNNQNVYNQEPTYYNPYGPKYGANSAAESASGIIIPGSRVESTGSPAKKSGNTTRDESKASVVSSPDSLGIGSSPNSKDKNGKGTRREGSGSKTRKEGITGNSPNTTIVVRSSEGQDILLINSNQKGGDNSSSQKGGPSSSDIQQRLNRSDTKSDSTPQREIGSKEMREAKMKNATQHFMVNHEDGFYASLSDEERQLKNPLQLEWKLPQNKFYMVLVRKLVHVIQHYSFSMKDAVEMPKDMPSSFHTGIHGNAIHGGGAISITSTTHASGFHSGSGTHASGFGSTKYGLGGVMGTTHGSKISTKTKMNQSQYTNFSSEDSTFGTTGGFDHQNQGVAHGQGSNNMMDSINGTEFDGSRGHGHHVAFAQNTSIVPSAHPKQEKKVHKPRSKKTVVYENPEHVLKCEIGLQILYVVLNIIVENKTLLKEIANHLLTTICNAIRVFLKKPRTVNQALACLTLLPSEVLIKYEVEHDIVKMVCGMILPNYTSHADIATYSCQILEAIDTETNSAKMMKYSLIQRHLLLIRSHSTNLTLNEQVLTCLRLLLNKGENRSNVFIRYGGCEELCKVLKRYSQDLHNNKDILIQTFGFLTSLCEDPTTKMRIAPAQDTGVALLRIPLEQQDKDVRRQVGEFMRVFESSTMRNIEI